MNTLLKFMSTDVGPKILAGSVYLIAFGIIGLVIYFFVTLITELVDSSLFFWGAAGFLFISYLLGSYLFKKWG